MIDPLNRLWSGAGEALARNGDLFVDQRTDPPFLWVSQNSDWVTASGYMLPLIIAYRK